jgi:hypothetical protein
MMFQFHGRDHETLNEPLCSSNVDPMRWSRQLVPAGKNEEAPGDRHPTLAVAH